MTLLAMLGSQTTQNYLCKVCITGKKLIGKLRAVENSPEESEKSEHLAQSSLLWTCSGQSMQICA